MQAIESLAELHQLLSLPSTDEYSFHLRNTCGQLGNMETFLHKLLCHIAEK